MGGYLPYSSGLLMPSTGGGLSIAGLISQGITALTPLIQRAAGTSVTKATGTLGKIIAGGAGMGAGSTLAEQLLSKITNAPGILTNPFAAKRRRRHMNYCNARALRRSLRRVQGFSKFARKSFYLEKQVRIKKRRRR